MFSDRLHIQHYTSGLYSLKHLIKIIGEQYDYCIGQDGDREVTVEEVAAPANSFNYELVCNISRRVPRTYIRDGRELGQVNYLLD